MPDQPGPPEGAVPSLDELAGAWLPTGTLLSMPAVSNGQGSAHAGTNLLSFTELTFPPVSLGGEGATVAVNGVRVQAQHSRWYPYQVLRRAQLGAVELESALRLGFGQPLVLAELTITNTGNGPARAQVTVDLGGYLRRYPGPWPWTVPRPYGGFTAWTGQLTGDGQVLTVADTTSEAAAAFAFPDPPTALVAAASSGTATWDLTLTPGQPRTLQLLMTSAASAEAAAAAAASARPRFGGLFSQAKAGWERRFSDAFTPGNGHFSGSLPVLATGDPALRRLYYASVLSVLALERTCYPALGPRVYTTAGPQWGVTLSYLWDTSLFAPVLVLLDPAMAREQAMRWLALGIDGGYAVEALTGQLSGYWYSANDLSVFTVLFDYLRLTGDAGFADELVNGTSVIDHMQAIALHWQRLADPATGLADYGGTENLLEEVASYVNQVPSLNAANVWMMRQLAGLREARGEAGAAAELRTLAGQLASRVLGRYVPGQGVWDTVHANGTRVTVRHVYDFGVIGSLLAADLTRQVRGEMTAFLTSELLAAGWLRALSESDPQAPLSLRPDHGSNGAYDAWPALAAAALGSFGGYGEMLELLRGCAAVTAEGPFAQSHQLVPEPSGLIVWDRDDLNPAAALTVAAWLKPAAWPGDRRSVSVVSKAGVVGAWYPLTPPNAGYALRGGPGGVISFTVAAGGTARQAVTTAAVPPGGWHHVAGTYDGQRITVYLDGEPSAVATASGAITPAAGVNLMVAADPIDPDGKFTGAVDEVRVYTRALTAAEIAALHAAGGPGCGSGDPSLVLRLPLDAGSGQDPVDAVTGLAAAVLAGDQVPGRYGAALSFAKSATLTTRISRQQYHENNGGAFAAVILTCLFGYAPDGQQITVRDPGTPRGVAASLHGVVWRGQPWTLTSGPAGIALTSGY
jgi:Concanavalin A-like lectin/glucanases superfamily